MPGADTGGALSLAGAHSDAGGEGRSSGRFRHVRRGFAPRMRSQKMMGTWQKFVMFVSLSVRGAKATRRATPPFARAGPLIRSPAAARAETSWVRPARR